MRVCDRPADGLRDGYARRLLQDALVGIRIGRRVRGHGSRLHERLSLSLRLQQQIEEQRSLVGRWRQVQRLRQSGAVSGRRGAGVPVSRSVHTESSLCGQRRAGVVELIEVEPLAHQVEHERRGRSGGQTAQPTRRRALCRAARAAVTARHALLLLDRLEHMRAELGLGKRQHTARQRQVSTECASCTRLQRRQTDRQTEAAASLPRGAAFSLDSQ